MKVVIVSIVWVASLSSVFSKTIPVCSACTFKTVKEAVGAAKDGDEIFIKAGVHTVSDVRIDKRLHLRGEKGTILDGAGKTIFFVAHDSVSISNLSLQNVATNYVEDRAAIKCHSSNYLDLHNLTIRATFFGIHIEKSKFGSIKNCDIRGNAREEDYLESANGNAIHLWYCKNMNIEANRVMRHRDGIYFEFVENSTILNNWSEGNMRYGLHFMFSHTNTYTNNTFYRNEAGVAVMYSNKVTMINNKFLESWGESAYGLLLKDITDSELHGNTFHSNTIAISMDNAMRIQIHHNVLSRNGYAMRIFGNCGQNEITQNDFLQNTFDVSTNSSTNYNTFSGNYWEEYTGYDLDHDGTGDVPFRPVKLFTYINAQAPASIILLRSTFIDLLNLAEKITPVLTPETLVDTKPAMRPIHDRT